MTDGGAKATFSAKDSESIMSCATFEHAYDT